MKVRAIATGFYGNQLRQEDDVFDVEDKMTATWFIPLNEAKKVNSSAELPETEEEAKRYSNKQLTEMLEERGVKIPENANKAELARLLIADIKGDEDLV